MTTDRAVPVRELILVPSLITLAITILRLVGELLDWSPQFFGKSAGGGGSLVGISWLVPVFGIYFAVRLVRAGFAPPKTLLALGAAIAGIVAMAAAGIAANMLKWPLLAALGAIAVASWIAVWLAWRGWPALGRTLLAYAFAARVPVVLVMLVAILGHWGTHYDVAPPEAPQIDAWNPLLKWFVIGVVPQLTIWIGFTLAFGALFGAIAAPFARRRASAAAEAPVAP